MSPSSGEQHTLPSVLCWAARDRDSAGLVAVLCSVPGWSRVSLSSVFWARFGSRRPFF